MNLLPSFSFYFSFLSPPLPALYFQHSFSFPFSLSSSFIFSLLSLSPPLSLYGTGSRTSLCSRPNSLFHLDSFASVSFNAVLPSPFTARSTCNQWEASSGVRESPKDHEGYLNIYAQVYWEDYYFYSRVNCLVKVNIRTGWVYKLWMFCLIIFCSFIFMVYCLWLFLYFLLLFFMFLKWSSMSVSDLNVLCGYEYFPWNLCFFHFLLYFTLVFFWWSCKLYVIFFIL